eukprot:CAMPEP_0172305634 /NCGR_PEP_ID=MMETSP1058-20130122/6884_1 /TAXON_ID=83371 /ORGANISM="Detonula confervacea, Strain CCMP 353" /LENGTH=357 /DNA_ID=CAMNT_0013017297 /DNA_START=132 /DNA_END=1205 /DNA_ORIENTATION=+
MDGNKNQPIQKDDNSDEKSTSKCWTDEEFESFLRKELEKHPLSKEYPELFATAPKLICKWRQRYQGNPSLWKRLFQKDRVLKEFIESVPVIDAVQRLVVNSELFKNGQKFTIVDLACGRGYLSMFLSELLPPNKVEKFILVDQAWPMHNMTPEPHHISWTHIYGSSKKVEDQSVPNYYDTWPIRLNTCKVNLKKSKEISSMEERLFTNYSEGPVILVAVHLCGTLSLKAVELFNNNPGVCFFCLKPCCLPGMVHVKRDEIFRVGEHSFDSKLVCMAGKWKKNVWRGPPRKVTTHYFQRWVDNLLLGMNDADAEKIKKTIMVQHTGGYQNDFLFAERLPETAPVWDVLRQEEELLESE